MVFIHICLVLTRLNIFTIREYLLHFPFLSSHTIRENAIRWFFSRFLFFKQIQQMSRKYEKIAMAVE